MPTEHVTPTIAEQCGLYEAALGIVAGRAASALALPLPLGELASELAAIRDYAAGALVRGSNQGPEGPGKRAGS